MIESFSPVDAVELLSNPAQTDSTMGGNKHRIWVILITIILVIGVGLLISRTQREKFKEKND